MTEIEQQKPREHGLSRREALWRLGSAGAALAFIAACGGDNKSGGSAPTATATTASGAAATSVKAVATTTAQSSAPVLQVPSSITAAVAGGVQPQQASYFIAMKAWEDLGKKHDFDLKYQAFSSGPDGVAALVGGSANLLISGAPGVMAAAAAAQDIRAVYNVYFGPANLLVGRKKYEADRGSDVATYKGGTFGYTQVGSTSYSYERLLAEHAGLDWEKDVTGLAVGGAEGFVPALQAGHADVVMCDTFSAATAGKLGVGYVVFNGHDVAAGAPIYGKPIGGVVISSGSFIDKYPELSGKLIKAMKTATEFVRSNIDDPAAVYAATHDEFKKGVTEEMFGYMWTYAKLSFVEGDGTFSDESVRETFELFKSIGQVKPGIGLEAVRGAFDSSILESV